MGPLIPVIAATLVFAAFFSGIEIAFLSSNKFRIELENKQGKIPARILSFFLRSPARFIATILVGFNIALVIYGIFMAELLDPFIKRFIPTAYQGEVTMITMQTLLSTIIVLVAVEFVPKIIFRKRPNTTLRVFSLPVLAAYIILFPLVYVVLMITKWSLKLMFKIELVESSPVFGRIDLDHYISELATKTPVEHEMNTELQMFQNVLDFNRVKVRECMVPRTEIIAMNADDSVENLKSKFISTGLSKILIYRDNIDNLIGFVHSIEMFKNPESIQAVLLPLNIVPETMPARELLTLFMQQHRSVAQVVDEHGLTAGMVTIEDVMEEIFGEIDDEHDTEEMIEKKISDSEYIFSGRLEVDYLNNEYSLHIPYSQEYETLGGYIFHHHQSIPAIKEDIVIPPFRFTVLSLKGNRIDQVKMVREKEV